MEALRQPSHIRFAITEQADIGAVRRALRGYAAQLGTGQRLAHAELVATELATNLIRHAKPGGWLLARPLPPAGIELIAVDRGPGMAQAGSASTGRPGELGAGLEVVRRTARHFDVHTRPGTGTVVLAVVDLADSAPAPAARTWAGVSIGLGEACGDGWAVAECPDGLAVAVVDGLGHGPLASAAADTALAVFARAPTDLDRFVVRANEATRATRGGVVAVCHLVRDRDELRYLVVGNISGRVVAGGRSRSLPGQPGALGIQIAPPRAATGTLAWRPGAVLLLWSDGLRSGIEPPDPAVLGHDPAIVAALLHRDHTRERDDATVVAVRHPDP
jgi:anti-sigma regulatory factor (Ser/Thr protein kinase)/acyl-coenzyme A thioesterase PaaI-like protein